MGLAQIRANLTKVRDAVAFIHDETVKGMVAGVPVAQIQANLRLPEALTPRAGRSPHHWIARAVFEEYTGWFHQDHTSELYPSDASSVWGEVVQAMGGAGAVAARAQAQLAAGEAEKALHLIEMAVHAEPENRQAREVELAVYEALADATLGLHFDLLGWLEGKIMAARAALSA